MTEAYQFPERHDMDAPEVAQALRISRNHVYRLAKSGELPSIRLGRRVKFPTAAIKQMLHVEKEKPDTVGAEPGLT